MAVLQDIRLLFNKNQETQVNAVQITEEAKKGVLEEDGEDAKWGQHSTELETDWEDIVKLVDNMGLTLVPNENFSTEEGKNIAVRKIKGKRELRNLSFNVHFKDSKFRRVTFNSK